MRTAVALLVTLSAGLIWPGSAMADDMATRHAARCLIAVAGLTQSNDATVKMSGLLGSMFFAGQFFGAAPDADMEAVLKREAVTIDDAAMKQLLTQCGQELQLRGGQMSAAGEALKALDLRPKH